MEYFPIINYGRYNLIKEKEKQEKAKKEKEKKEKKKKDKEKGDEGIESKDDSKDTLIEKDKKKTKEDKKKTKEDKKKNKKDKPKTKKGVRKPRGKPIMPAHRQRCVSCCCSRCCCVRSCVWGWITFFTLLLLGCVAVLVLDAVFSLWSGHTAARWV